MTRSEWVRDYERTERRIWKAMTTTITIAWIKEKDGKWNSAKDTNDQWYSYAKADISLTKGKTYVVETRSKESNGRTYWDITSAAESTVGRSKAPSVDSGPDRWYMPFVSNTVAHAIAAGHIKSPADIAPWAAYAKNAAAVLEQAPKREAGEDPFEP